MCRQRKENAKNKKKIKRLADPVKLANQTQVLYA